MNTDPAFTRPDPEYVDADLSGILRLVVKLASNVPMGRDWRKTALALSTAGDDIERMTGLVIDGETYSIEFRKEHAVCRCGDGKHEARRDAPPGRAAWQTTRREADASLATAIDRWQWAGGRTPKPHRVFHIVATTSTEAVA